MARQTDHRLRQVWEKWEKEVIKDKTSELNPLILGVAAFGAGVALKKENEDNISRREIFDKLKSWVKKVGFAAFPIIAISAISTSSGCGDGCKCEGVGNCACDTVCTCQFV